MSHALYHAESSAERHGGTPDDYLALHALIDAPQLHVRMPSVRGRAVFHHTWGIELCARLFACGANGTLSLREQLPAAMRGQSPDATARAVANGHVQEDLRDVPTLDDWLAVLTPPRCIENNAHIPTADQALLSSRHYGGNPESYAPIHELLDAPLRHATIGNASAATALLHNTFGIALCETVFGHYIVVGEEGERQRIPTRYIARAHIERECGRFVPTLDACLADLKTLPWMGGRARSLSRRSGAGRLREGAVEPQSQTPAVAGANQE